MNKLLVFLIFGLVVGLAASSAWAGALNTVAPEELSPAVFFGYTPADQANAAGHTAGPSARTDQQAGMRAKMKTPACPRPHFSVMRTAAWKHSIKRKLMIMQPTSR